MGEEFFNSILCLLLYSSSHSCHLAKIKATFHWLKYCAAERTTKIDFDATKTSKISIDDSVANYSFLISFAGLCFFIIIFIYLFIFLFRLIRAFFDDCVRTCLRAIKCWLNWWLSSIAISSGQSTAKCILFFFVFLSIRLCVQFALVCTYVKAVCTEISFIGLLRKSRYSADSFSELKPTRTRTAVAFGIINELLLRIINGTQLNFIWFFFTFTEYFSLVAHATSEIKIGVWIPLRSTRIRV